MSARLEGAFSACMQFAATQASDWVPRWLMQLTAALHEQEGLARSFNEKQSLGLARTVLATYRERVTERFLQEIASLNRSGRAGEETGNGEHKLKTFSLDELTLVDHEQVQQKVDFSRVQHLVRMTADEPAAKLNALLSGALGLEVVRADVNMLLPDAIVSALARALSTLQLDDSVRAAWMQVGAVALGSELAMLYGAMASFLVQQGVKPVGHLRVKRSAEDKPFSAAPVERVAHNDPEDGPVSVLSEHGPQLSLAQLQSLLTTTLDESDSRRSNARDSSKELADSMAAEIVVLMLHRVATEPRLLQPIRDLVQGLFPGLIRLASGNPRFFADPENAAQQLLDAITHQGWTFLSEQDPGFAEFAERTRRVLGALQSVDGEWPALLRASLRRFPATGGSKRAKAGIKPAPSLSDRRAVAVCGTVATDSDTEGEPPTFTDTVPTELNTAFQEPFEAQTVRY